MSRDLNPTLLHIAEALADGLPVDWEELGVREFIVAERIARLRTFAEVAAAYRELREQADPGVEPRGG